MVADIMSKCLKYFISLSKKSFVRLITQHLFALVPVTVIQEQPQTTTRKPRDCIACKQPMKGYKNVTNCPRNQLLAE